MWRRQRVESHKGKGDVIIGERIGMDEKPRRPCKSLVELKRAGATTVERLRMSEPWEKSGRQNWPVIHLVGDSTRIWGLFFYLKFVFCCTPQSECQADLMLGRQDTLPGSRNFHLSLETANSSSEFWNPITLAALETIVLSLNITLGWVSKALALQTWRTKSSCEKAGCGGKHLTTQCWGGRDRKISGVSRISRIAHFRSSRTKADAVSWPAHYTHCSTIL